MTQSITLSDNKKRARKIFPDSFSRSVGTAKLKGLQVRFCLYLYFNLFDISKVSLFSYFGASQWLQDAHKVSELFTVWDMPGYIISNLSEKWSEPDGLTNRLKLVCLTFNCLEKSRKNFPFFRAINKLPDNYIISLTCCLFDFLISRNNFLHLLPFKVSSDETVSIFPCCLFDKKKDELTGSSSFP